MAKSKRQQKLEELYKQFEGMPAAAITAEIPTVKVDLFRSRITGNINHRITECPLCSQRHLHGGYFLENDEYRVIHCKNLLDGRPYPQQYRLLLDWNHGNNAKYKAAYMKQKREYERNPDAFNRETGRKARKYHEKQQSKREEKLMYGYW